jgi:hypothetical protein
MKTPRDILLARHRAVEPKLDAIRQAVVGKLNNEETKEPGFPAVFVSWFLGCSENLWRELIFPSRRIWAGLAAVWIVIFIVNFSQRDPERLMARKLPPPSPEAIQAWQQQQRLLAELIGPNEPRAAQPQKPLVPRPSTERRFEVMTA